MKGFLCLFLLFVITKGDRETNCEVIILKCRFRENMSDQRKDFKVYSYPDYGPSELLVECGWNGNNLTCILQPGINVIQPVSDIVEIVVPIRPISNIGCEPGGSTPEIINPCQLFETTRDYRQEKAVQVETGHQEKHDQKETKSALMVITIMVGAFLGADVLVFLYVFIIIRKKVLLCLPSV